MPADAGRKTENLVGYRADLDADAALLHLVHDVRVARQGEAVANTLRTEEEGVHKVAVGLGANVKRLAAMEEERNFLAGGLA